MVVIAQHVPVDRRDDAEVAGIWEDGIENVQLLLMDAVDSKRLFVGLSWQPVVKHSCARTQRRRFTLERSPGGAEPRTEVAGVAHMRLELVTNSRAQRKVLRD